MCSCVVFLVDVASLSCHVVSSRFIINHVFMMRFDLWPLSSLYYFCTNTCEGVSWSCFFLNCPLMNLK